MGIVDAKQTGEHELTLEWESSASNDMVADSALALITGIDKSPASAKRKHLPSKVTPSFFLSHPPGSSLSSEFTLTNPRGASGDLKICVAMTVYPNADDQQPFAIVLFFSISVQ